MEADNANTVQEDNQTAELEVGWCWVVGTISTATQQQLTSRPVCADRNVNCIVEACSLAYLVPDPAATIETVIAGKCTRNYTN